jgi:thioredoxin reductase/Pyruvate/2-oxoacid:ferredoxin oxidoreductase delta subunit
MLVTTLLFLIVSAALIAWQAHANRARAAAVAIDARACPRCRARVPEGDLTCPRCSAPLQAYEVVTAKVVEPSSAGADGPLHALVRADMCVGCGTCVAACPEPGAIRLVDKVATVALDRCKGHGQCASACPVGAIVVGTGAAVQRVEVPDLDIHFQTSVPGLHIVGELGGRGLIKNAINEGKLAIEHIASEVRPDRARAARPGARGGDAGGDGAGGEDAGGAYDVVIVGSGPAGLSAALASHHAGLRFLVLEQGSLSETIHRYPRQKLLFAEPVRIPLYGDLWVADASKESLLKIWQDVIARYRLPILTGTRVENVTREGGLFHVQAGAGAFYAKRVVLAMGRRGTPRRLGVPGEQLDKVFYDIVEMEAFAGQRALVVGGGDSAIESALGLANQPGTPVTLSYRGAEFGRVKDRNRAKLDAAVAAGRLRVLLGSQVREIRPELVVMELDGQPHLEPNDVVIVRIGGDPPAPFLHRLGVRIVQKELAIAAGGAG